MTGGGGAEHPRKLEKGISCPESCRNRIVPRNLGLLTRWNCCCTKSLSLLKLYLLVSYYIVASFFLLIYWYGILVRVYLFVWHFVVRVHSFLDLWWRQF